MNELDHLVMRAQAGDLEAFGRVVTATQRTAYAVAMGVLRDSGLAEDAVQEAYLRAFRRLRDLDEPAAFVSWLRRIVITVALNIRRARRTTLLVPVDDVPQVPVLDEEETSWSERQRSRLAEALLTLTPAERQMCDRRYYGQWSVARLAREAGVAEPVMRKRLQRIRDRLRREVEVSEQRELTSELGAKFPQAIVELLARPKLIDLPENPVGRILEGLRQVYADFREIDLPEIIDLDAARNTIVDVAMYVDTSELHRVDQNRILRYDLTLPLLLTARYEGVPLKLWAAGKTYRVGQIDELHLEAFHQAEVFCLDDRRHFDGWRMTGHVLQSVDALLPGRAVRITPTVYPMCSQAWELSVEADGRWSEVLAWGVFTDRIVRYVGGDPAVHTAIGVGYGLERVAMLRYAIDDIRKIERAHVA